MLVIAQQRSHKLYFSRISNTVTVIRGILFEILIQASVELTGCGGEPPVFCAFSKWGQEGVYHVVDAPAGSWPNSHHPHHHHYHRRQVKMGITTYIKSVTPPSLFIFLLTTAALVSALPAGAPKTVTKVANAVGQDPAAPEPDNGCGFSGNQDVYGLGIRVGLYAQWLSTFLSNWLHQRKVTKMRDVNTCFQLAMLTALLSISNQGTATHAIDPYIIIIQIIGSVSHLLNPHRVTKAKTNLKLRHQQSPITQLINPNGTKPLGVVSSASSSTSPSQATPHGSGGWA